MFEYKKFNFTSVVFAFKGKNGNVVLNKEGQIYIGREGWFGIPYQLITRGPVLFTLDDVKEVVIKEPDLMRGYMDIILLNNKKARVWLTRPAYVPYAQHMKELIDNKKKVRKKAKK